MSTNDKGFYDDFRLPEGYDDGAAARDGGEIAELRRRLMQALNRRPDDMRFLVQAANALVRAAAAEQGMSPAGKKRLAESMTELLEGLGEQFAGSETTTVRALRQAQSTSPLEADGPSTGSG